MTVALPFALAAALAAPAVKPKPLPAPRRDTGFALTLCGGVAAVPLSWQAPASWTLNAETARLEGSQEASLGPVAEAAVSFRFARRFGIAAAFEWARRDGSAEIEAELPHPLYLARPRSVRGTTAGLGYRQLASHLDLEWRPVRGKLELALFAGPSFLRVDADLVESVTANEAYPYDEAVFAAAQTTPSRSASSLGWNAGAGLAGAIASKLDLGLQARYSRVKPELEAPGGGSLTLTAGGLEITAFLRLHF